LFLHLEGYPIFSLVIALKIINDSLLWLNWYIFKSNQLR
jgi:hypothetical protein